VAVASKDFQRTEREEFRLASDLMPEWLNNLCDFRFPEPSIVDLAHMRGRVSCA
jgi:hypothetical protein